jgi:hypothetical protein
LQPGQQTTIILRFTMHAGMEGPHDFRVYLRTNDATAPETVLIVKSSWES